MKLLDKIIDFRRELHANPEASMKEVQTRCRIKEFLQANAPGVKIIGKDRWLYGLHDVLSLL